jgi:hypothetical protein
MAPSHPALSTESEGASGVGIEKATFFGGLQEAQQLVVECVEVIIRGLPIHPPTVRLFLREGIRQ